MMRGPEDVSKYLADSGVRHELRVLDQSTRTSALAAQALGCTVGDIAKSVVFLGPAVAVAVLSGDRRVDLDKLARVVGGPVRAGTPEEVAEMTGYKIGGVPPFPHGPEVRVLIDRSILGREAVWAAAGASNAVFSMKPGDLLRLAGGDVHDVSSPGQRI